MDERIVIDGDGRKILASSVADASGTGGAARNGDVDVAAYDLASGKIQHFVLHDNLQADDHNAAALLVRPDGRYLAVYTNRNSEKFSDYRVSTNPHDASDWQPEAVFDWGTTPASDFNVTYSNFFYLPAEGIVALTEFGSMTSETAARFNDESVQ
jgi:hypothetical protein